MAWSVVSDYTPSGTVAAGAAGSNLQNSGWVDVSGGIWSVTSGTLYAASSTNPWQTGNLARPASEAAAASQRQRIVFTQGKGDLYAYLLYNGGTTGANGYAGGLSDNSKTLNIYSVVGGSVTLITNVAYSSNPVSGTQYILDVSLIRNADGTNTITATRYASDGTTVIDTVTASNDATSALKGASGRPGIFEYLNGATQPNLTGIQRTTTYSQTSAATSYTLTGPSKGPVGSASSAFTVTPNGNVSANVVVTPSDGGNGGTFSPTTVTFASGTSTAQTFTYTPASAGSKTISTTNNGGLTDPASVTYVASNLVNIPVNSPAFRFSPGNWKGDTGRGGSVYRQTWNTGAYFEVTWTASSSPTAVVLIPSTSTGMIVSYLLNGAQTDGVAATGNIDISSSVTPSASNTLRMYVRNNPQSARWNNATNTLQIQGFQIDGASSAGTAATTSGWHLIVGDSLTEGIQAADGNDSFSKCWAYLFGQAINDAGRDYCLSACGYNGYLTPGDSGGDVPAYYYVSSGTYADASSRWNKIDAGVSLLDSAGQISAYGGTGTAPTEVWIMLSGNDARVNASTSDVTASVQQSIAAIRAAAPSARINIIIEFINYSAALYAAGPSMVTAVKAGLSAYQSANPSDTNVRLIDFGASFTTTIQSALYGGQIVHGNSAMHALEAARMIPKLAGQAAASVALPGFRPGFH